MKKIFLSLLLVISISAYAQTEPSFNRGYIATNIFSPFAGMKTDNAALFALVPIFTNLEYGFSLVGGYNINRFSAAETRLTLGRSNHYNLIPQIQLYYNFFVLDYFLKNGNRWYIGTSFRYFDYYNVQTEVHRHNFVFPTLAIGYMRTIGRIFVNVRLTQSLGIASFSSMEHTSGSYVFNLSPLPEMTPILPMLSLDIGYTLDW